jgi:hypothetical protein
MGPARRLKVAPFLAAFSFLARGATSLAASSHNWNGLK